MPSGMNRTIALLMFAIAIIMAAGVFLAMSVVSGRNEQAAPEGAGSNFQVNVAGEQISLRVNPETRPNIVGDESPRVEDAPPDEQVVEVTETPVVTPVPTTAEQATAVPATPAVEKVIFDNYTVQPGDTLSSISQRIDTSIALMADRGISQASLVPGQSILLPIGNPQYCAGRGRPYAVGEGDTAFNIGQRFNTTPANLQAINGLDANFTVKVADIICVP